MKEAEYDVVVIGGGPAGSATAIRLAMRGHSVAIVDQSRQALDHYETMSPEIRAALLELGVWDAFQSDGHLPSSGTISMWGSTVPTHTDHMMSPFQVGWHVNRRQFDQMLLNHAATQGAHVCRNTRFLAIARHGDSWKLDLQFERKTVSKFARFVVDATGRHSVVARQIGATRHSSDDLVALAGNCHGITPSQPCDSHSAERLIVEAVESGWCYAVPTGDRMYCVLVANGHDLPRAFDARLSYWKECLQQTYLLRGRGVNAASTEFRVLLANTSRLAAAVGNNWVAVGEAAFAIDPLSGQGLLNVMEGASLASVLISGFLSDRRNIQHARDQYQTFIDSKWQSAAVERRNAYRLERRWNGSRFWQQRHSDALTAELVRGS